LRFYFNVEKSRKFFEAFRYAQSYHHRFLLGATAIPLVGCADYFILSDEKKRNDSLSRNMAKIAAGTLAGVAVRYGSLKLINKYTKVGINQLGQDKVFIENKNALLFPKKYLGEHKGMEEDWGVTVDGYRKAISTWLAIFAMLFTNFAIDMPLTVQLSKFFRANFFKDNNPPNIFETPQIQHRLAFLARSQKPIHAEVL